MEIKIYTINVALPGWAKGKGVLVAGALALMGAIVVRPRADVTVPHVFVSGETLTADSLNANFSALRDGINQVLPPGTIVPFAGANVPSGWLLCDGSPVIRTTYASLFQSIGSVYGSGDGANTFNLPDLRGMFLRGAGTSSSRTKASGVLYSGGSLGQYQSDIAQGHTHVDSGHVHYVTVNSQASGTWVGSAVANGNHNWAENGVNTGVGRASLGDMSVTTFGSPRVGDETRPASFSINYVIKY
jgi:microcystin-dependent protein